LFIICGGLLGLMLFNLLCGVGKAAQGSGAGSSVGARRSSPLRRFFGVVILLGGGVLLALGLVHFWDTWGIAHRKYRPVSAAELKKAKGPTALPTTWIAYTFEQSKSPGIAVVRRRLGLGGEVEAPCLLVQVGDRWMMATVAPGFRGNRLQGRLLPLPANASKDLLPPLRPGEARPPALLPYEFNAIDSCESEHQQRYIQAGVAGFLGLLAVLLGLWLVRGGRQPAAPAAEFEGPRFSVRPLPHG
jgi:hypothetical protein